MILKFRRNIGKYMIIQTLLVSPYSSKTKEELRTNPFVFKDCFRGEG